MTVVKKIVYPTIVSVPEPKVLGLDVSTKTGAVLLQYRDDLVKINSSTVVKAPSPLTGFLRLNNLEGQINALLDTERPDLAVVEGYGFKNRFTLVTLVEIGTLFRRALLMRGIPVVTWPPKSAKQFATGNGNADKKMMIAVAYSRWGLKTKSDDEADACALAAAGLAYLGAINCTPKEKELVSQMSFLTCIPTAPQV